MNKYDSKDGNEFLHGTQTFLTLYLNHIQNRAHGVQFFKYDYKLSR